MKKIVSTLMVAMLGFCMTAIAQVHPVSGTVKDEQGAAVPSVTVKIKGTTTAVAADANGFFRISAADNAVLVFSAVGFTDYEQRVGRATSLNVSLTRKVSELENVVVTALGIKRRPKELGYAQATVKTEQLNQGQSPTIGQALSGKVAGLTILNQNASVNQDVKVVLRGYRSISGNNEALIVLDGVQVPSTVLGSINPQDIENVSVLKGGQAATLYGSEGANGVLLITTKKGNVRPSINFVHTTTWDAISFMPKFQESFGSGSDYGGNPLSIDNFRPFENQQYGDAYNGQMRDIGRVLADGSHLQLPYAAVKNQKKDAFNIGNTITNTLSLGAGDDKTGRYFMSIQDNNVQGVVPHDESHRTSFRFNASRVFGKLRAGFDGNFVSDRTQRTNSDFYNLVFNTPSWVPLTNFRDWVNNKFANPNGYFNDYYDNPYFDADNRRRDDRNNSLNGAFNIGYKATSWLDISYRIGTSITNLTRKDYVGQFLYTPYASTSAKTFDLAFNDYNGIYRARTNNLGSVSDFAQWKSQINSDFIVTVDKKFNDFSLKALAGMSVLVKQQRQSTVTNASIVLPGLYSVTNTAGVLTGSDNATLSRKFGYYGDVTIGYKDVAFLHGSVRQDKSSVFYDISRESNPSLYTFTYPGVDASVILSDIFPTIKSSTLSYLKLRGDFNVNKADNVGPYNLFPVYGNAGGFPYGTTVGLTAGTTYPDANLRPETISTVEGGLEIGLFNNRINLDMSLYSSKSKDLIMLAGVPPTTGYNNYLVNAASMTTTGFELDLKANVIKKRDMNWDVNFNYTYNNNIVNSIFQGLPRYQSGSLGTSAYEFAELNNPFPFLKVSGYQRDPSNGAYVVDATNHWYVKDLNLVPKGNMLAKNAFGFSTNFTWKAFTVATTLEARTGYWIFNGGGLTSAFTGAGAQTNENGRKPYLIANSETYDAATGKYTPNSTNVSDYFAWYGGMGDVGGPTSKANIGEWYATSGSFLKMRDASISYALPQDLLKRTKFVRSVSLTLIGRNLFMVLPKENIYSDPEFNAFATTSNNVGLNTTSNTPTTRSYGFSVNIGF